MTTYGNPVKLSIANLEEIVTDGSAACYHCTNTSIAWGDITRTLPDRDGETAICPDCGVDALVASRHLPYGKAPLGKCLTAWRWAAWDFTRNEDLEDPYTFQEIIDNTVEDAAPEKMERDYLDCENFVEETDWSQSGIQDWTFQSLCELRDDAIYNQWQVGQWEMTDGIQQDGDLFFEEIQQHHCLAERPQCQHVGDAFYSCYSLPEQRLRCLTTEEHRDLVGTIIGHDGCHLKMITEQMGAYYIWYSQLPEDTHRSKGLPKFEIWAPEPVLAGIQTTLETWAETRIRQYLTSYWLKRFTELYERFGCVDEIGVDYIEDLLDQYQGQEQEFLCRQERVLYHMELVDIYEKFNPSMVDDVDMLLDKYEGKWVSLLRRVTQKYAPDGCQVCVCPRCDIHFCPNFPPILDSRVTVDDTSCLCDDCFGEVKQPVSSENSHSYEEASDLEVSE